MNTKDSEDVKDTIEQEGFDYAFVYYSSFDNIKDKEFHRLRKAYVRAHEKLAEYVGIEE